jgi:uncharacterized membrane protein
MFDFTLLISAIVFVTIDFFYLNLLKSYFANQIKKIQNKPMTINVLGVLLCYIFLIFGINYFIIKPKRSVQDAFLLGLIIYGVYETTNLATFDDWSLFMVVMDTLWGGVLFALTTYIVSLFRITN